MFWWRLPQAVCALSACACLILAYEDDIEVNYADTFYNEITDGETPEPTPSPTPCTSRDLSKWDKIFTMLENSEMRENMLLQYADEIVKVELASLRGELLRFVSQYGYSCGVALEASGRKMAVQMEGRIRETMERLRPRDQTAAAAWNSNHLEAMLQQLLSAAQTQASRLAKLETSCFSGPGAGTGLNAKPRSQLPEEAGGAGLREQEVTPQEVALEGVLAAMEQIKVELGEVLRSSRQRSLPAGCEMALLFPMRSRRIYTSVIPDVPLSVSSFTVCMWVKPTTMSNRTVLFSYGNRRNPYEIQLLLGQTSALLTIGGEAHLVEARDVVKPGGPSEWIHLCGAWSSEQGLASLWAGGKKVASTPGVAEGHVLPDGGSLLLGQERNDCCPQSPNSRSGVAGFDGGFDPKMAFAGKMTGVNMWDRALSEGEISQIALREGQGRGNMVAWGVTEMVPHGGAQFIN
ncbi:pentraxin-related protein PTX3 [Pseudoliparis swirei]|uniref:pentraxin-related protein PTX3 n=1 Tax=Pseudoliparis swirei TaxID=2059687 RepID=UPI0024BEDE7F|nr:pentraxin-related protein PTX3 [Pseudoliparis swirei]XP_056297081.1 pentraxin-related protein PTX3 [Pseudoliparis swirei]